MLIDLSVKPGARQLRWFAGLWLPLLCVMLGIAAARAHFTTLAYVIWTVGVGLGVSGLIRPSTIQPVYSTLIWLTFPIGWIVSHVVLLTMYFVVITPIGALVRLFHDPMERAFDSNASSYWIEREQSPPARYFRQF